MVLQTTQDKYTYWYPRRYDIIGALPICSNHPFAVWKNTGTTSLGKINFFTSKLDVTTFAYLLSHTCRIILPAHLLHSAAKLKEVFG
jgi:hypothetical protein